MGKPHKPKPKDGGLPFRALSSVPARAVQEKDRAAQVQYDRLKDLRQAKRYAEAETIARSLVAQLPRNENVHHALGKVYAEQGRYPEAILCYRRAVELNPRHPDIAARMHDLAFCLWPIDPKGALDIINTAADRGFMPPEQRCQRGTVACGLFGAAGAALLALGDFAQGWLLSMKDGDTLFSSWYPADIPPEVAATWLQRDEEGEPVTFSFTAEEKDRFHISHRLRAERGVEEWDGSPLFGKTIAVFDGWGLGDAIQWVRWLPLLKQNAKAEKVVFVCRTEIARLVSSMPDFTRWVDVLHIPPDLHGPIPCGPRPCVIADLPPFDCWTPLCWLTYHADKAGVKGIFTLWDTPAFEGRYLRAEQAETERWAARLAEIEEGERPALRIGVAWAAGGQDKNGQQRSFPARLLAPLTEIPGVRVYSLQKGKDAAQVADVPGIFPLSDEFSDFAETAAIIANLDMVVCCDTSVTHVAAAIGKPTFVALPFFADARWGPKDAPALVYPRYCRKFQQEVRGRWDEPIARLIAAVRPWAAFEAVRQLFCAERYAEAEARGREAVAQFPDSGPLYSLLGRACMMQRRGRDAIPHLRRAADLFARHDPKHPLFVDCLQGLALCLRPIDPEAALVVANEAKTWGFLPPDPAASRETAAWKIEFTAGEALLSRGDFQNGWPRFADDRLSLLHNNWRDVTTAEPLSRRLSERGAAWEGEALDGRTILVFQEGGLGDVVLWSRFLPLLKTEARAATVVLAATEPLARLLSSMPDFEKWVDVVYSPTDGPDAAATPLPCDVNALPAFDSWCLLNEIPYFMDRAGVQGFLGLWNAPPHRGRYLRPEPEEVTRWAGRLAQIENGARPALRVGVAWAAGEQTENGRQRSFPARLLAPLTTLPGVRLYSLQRGRDAPQVADMPDIVPLSDEFSALTETAAVMESMDVIVTCDTVLANLAPALGRPTFVLLPYLSDWRWGAKDAPGPLFPSVRKFEQDEQGRWEPVIEQVRQALVEYQPAREP